CQNCHAICDSALCEVCSHHLRSREFICCVEDIRDVLAIENTGEYDGDYHVLGSNISLLMSIRPQQSKILSLDKRASNAKEIILALSSTMEGDTTMFYLYKVLKDSEINLTTIARGIGIGDELEYTDEITLIQSIQHRVPYAASLSN